MSETYEQAQAIADQLLFSGVKPTQQLVRDQLGRGSLSTINRALQDWWAQLGPRLNERQQLPELPPAMADAMRQLWELAVDTARREAREHQLELEEQVRRSKQAVKTMQTQLDSEKSELLSRIEKLTESVQTLQSSNGTLQQELIVLERQTLKLERRCGEQEREKRADEAVIGKLEKALAAQEASLAARQLKSLQDENANLRKAIEQIDARR